MTLFRRSMKSLGSRPHESSMASRRIPIDGVSFAYTFNDPTLPGRLHHPVLRDHGQPSHLPRRLDGFGLGPRLPWVPGLPPGIQEWTPDHDPWELYNLDEDWTQANDLAAADARKTRSDAESYSPSRLPSNSVYPVGGGLWVVVLHPELRISTPYREWNFAADITRMPEFCAPALGNRDNL